MISEPLGPALKVDVPGVKDFARVKIASAIFVMAKTYMKKEFILLIPNF